MAGLAAFLMSHRLGRPMRGLLSRGFSAAPGRKLLIAYEARRISEAQVFPFAYFGADIAARHGAEIRFIDNARLKDAVPQGLRGATHVIFQSWLTDPPERLKAITRTLVHDLPRARLSYFDGFANNDLRFARFLDPHVSTYAKKSLFRDRTAFLGPTLGDTNLVDYYSRRYGLEDRTVDWAVPPAFLNKLHLTPNFFTAPQFLTAFRNCREPEFDRRRSVDVHARLATKGSGWYSAMRQEFLDRLCSLPGLAIRSGGSLPWAAYMTEMADARICASPFGYGELCWRDIEAFLTGAALLKPDMSHLDTLPGLYRPWETYVPVAWDLSDLADAVAWLLEDDDRRVQMARTAFASVRDYLSGDRFARDIGFVFEDHPVPADQSSPVNTSRSVPTS